jgi:hypothetical protein
MTDASETIWAVHWNTEGAVLNGAWADTIRHFGCGVEYRRADLPLTTEQIMADPRVKALVDALDVIAERPTHEGGCYYNNRLSVFEARAALAQLKETKV